jgi:hypothetical protein
MPAIANLAWSGEFWRLRRRTPMGTSCLDIGGSDWIWLCAPCFFFWLFGFRGRIAKLCYPLLSWDTSLTFHDEVRSREWHDIQDMRTRNCEFCLCDVVELAWWFVTWRKQQHYKWDDSTWELQSLILQGENPRSSLNWLCLAIALLLFYEQGLSP